MTLTSDLDVPRRAFVAQIMGLPISLHLRGPGVRTPAVEAGSVAAVQEPVPESTALLPATVSSTPTVA